MDLHFRPNLWGNYHVKIRKRAKASAACAISFRFFTSGSHVCLNKRKTSSFIYGASLKDWILNFPVIINVMCCDSHESLCCSGSPAICS